MKLALIHRYLDLQLPPGQSCFLWGARKSGKSSYLRERFPTSLHIDLLESDVYQQFYKSPHQLVDVIRANPKESTIILDEVQKIPLLLDEVHRLIELYKDKQFILCGSSARRLKQTGANLLGGRAWRFIFTPLCYPELKTLDWKRIFNHGLIPNHYLADERVEKSLAAYLYDYILTEVHFEANLRRREPFARFLDVLGISNGELINYSHIARDCGVDSKTVRSYFEILEDMYLGYYLHPFRSRSKRQTIQETPRFYLFDTGLANYLKRYQFQAMIGIEAGKSFEHYIFLELIAYKYLTDKREDPYFWRTKEGYEVDFIFQEHACEVKISDCIQRNHIRGLLKFSEENPHQLHVICCEPKKRIISVGNNEITIWPVQDFLDALWGHQLWH